MPQEPPLYTRQRDAVSIMKEDEWQAALNLAQGIDEPWFRCQALSHVVTICPTMERSLGTLEQAFAAAESIPDINRKVSVSAWPISSALALSLDRLAFRHTSRVLDLLPFEPNPVRRMDACALLISKLASDLACLELALNAFLQHAREAQSWKVA